MQTVAEASTTNKKTLSKFKQNKRKQCEEIIKAQAKLHPNVSFCRAFFHLFILFHT